MLRMFQYFSTYRKVTSGSSQCKTCRRKRDHIFGFLKRFLKGIELDIFYEFRPLVSTIWVNLLKNNYVHLFSVAAWEK